MRATKDNIAHFEGCRDELEKVQAEDFVLAQSYAEKLPQLVLVLQAKAGKMASYLVPSGRVILSL